MGEVPLQGNDTGIELSQCGAETARAYNFDDPITIESDKGILGRIAHGTMRAGQGGILFLEVTPANELMRMGALAASIKAGHDPAVSAGIYSGVTLGIEGLAALTAASVLDTNIGKKTVDWFSDKLQKRGISPEAKFTSLTKAGIAFLGGSAIVTFVKHREDPERSKNENRKYGLKSAAGLSGFCAVQGYLIAKGIDAPSPATVGGAVLAVASIPAAFKVAKRRIRKEETEQGIDPDTLENVTDISSARSYAERRRIARDGS